MKIAEEHVYANRETTPKQLKDEAPVKQIAELERKSVVGSCVSYGNMGGLSLYPSLCVIHLPLFDHLP